MKKIFNILLIMTCFSIALNAQKRSNQTVKSDLSFVVRNSQGEAIPGANVFANDGKYELQADEEGMVSIKGVPGNTKVLIQSPGYIDFVWDLSKSTKKSEVIMQKALAGESPVDTYDMFNGIVLNKRQTVGAVSLIEGKELETYPTLALSNALQGRAAGLSSSMGLGAMSENNVSFLIRGLHRQDGNAPIVVIDGMERSMNDLIAEEIEKIQVMKDATAKILYGPRAANGVISVTTKRGEAHKRVVKASVEQYISQSTRMPEYLNAFEYAKLYNKALENDGLKPIYSEADIEGYKNSQGAFDMRYPDADYYGYFLRDFTDNTRATTQFYGGDDKTRYAVVFGYNHGNGLENVGNGFKYDRVNLRGNVDMELNSIFSANVGIAIRIENKKWSKMNSGQLFSRLSNTRPNEYPFALSADTTLYPGVPTLENGSPVAGASMDDNSNLYADIVLDGYDKTQYINNQMNLGIGADLNSVVEGLTADTYVTFDNFFLANYRLDRSTPTYAIRWDKTSAGADTAIFIPRKLGSLDATENLQSRNSNRYMGASAKVNYERGFGDHNLQSNLGYYFYLNEVHGWDQNFVEANTYLRTHYSYKDKYIVEATLAGMRSNRFARDKQFNIYPALGAAWIISEDVPSLGYMKVKASWGILGYDGGTSYPLRSNRWNNTNNITFGDGNNGKSYPVVRMINYGSPLLGWEESNEVNIGLEGMALKGKLGYEINLFSETRSNIEGVIDELYSELYGVYIPHENYKEVKNSGVDLSIDWNERKGDFAYSFGINAMYAKNEFTQKDEPEFDDEFRRLEGKPTDAIMGYVAEGLFTSTEQIQSEAFQALGTQTAIGDINYKDLNNDGVIDEFDQKVIGNNTPRMVMGIDINLQYKGFGLYALGTAAMGYYVNQKDLYYTTGNQKYMSYAYDAFDPATGEGTLPRLTAQGRSANNVNSDFWLEKGDYFRLKNVELSYTFRADNHTAVVNKTKLFVRGANLFVLSAIKDVDPELPKGGISNYPVFRTFSAGVSVNF